jgi:hypothetical protein
LAAMPEKVTTIMECRFDRGAFREVYA